MLIIVSKECQVLDICQGIIQVELFIGKRHFLFLMLE